MAKAFPKKLFVKIEKPQNDEPYFTAAESVDGMVDVGEEVKIAVYQLSHVAECEGVIKMTEHSKKKD